MIDVSVVLMAALFAVITATAPAGPPPAGAGRRAAPSVPVEIFPAFVASVEQLAAALDKSEHAGRLGMIAAPTLACLRNWPAPPVALRSEPVPPLDRPRMPRNP